LYADLVYSVLYSLRPFCIEDREEESKYQLETELWATTTNSKANCSEKNDYLAPFASEVRMHELSNTAKC